MSVSSNSRDLKAHTVEVDENKFYKKIPTALPVSLLGGVPQVESMVFIRGVPRCSEHIFTPL